MKRIDGEAELAGDAFLHGEIRYLEKGADYGLIECSDGRHVHFDNASVKGIDFFRLRTGDRVVFSMKTERQVPQATTVYLADRIAFPDS